MEYAPRKHLAGTLGQQTFCNSRPWRRRGVVLVRTDLLVVDLETFKKMKWSDGQCGRCFIKLCAQEGTPTTRQQ